MMIARFCGVFGDLRVRFLYLYDALCEILPVREMYGFSMGFISMASP